MKRKSSGTPVKTRLRKGDQVRVIAGEAKGQRGRIMRVDRERGRAIVEGLNLVKRHLRKSPDRPQGGIVEIEAPIALSNLVRTEERAEKKAEAPA